MKPSDLSDTLTDAVASVDKDHEIEMIRSKIYHSIHSMIKLHDLLGKSSNDIEASVEARINLIDDYINTIISSLEEPPVDEFDILPECTSASSIGSVAMPLMSNTQTRKKGKKK